MSDLDKAAAVIRERAKSAPGVAIVLGSGLGGFAAQVEDAIRIPYGELPGWPISTAIGHVGELVLGAFKGAPIAVMRGRAHLYEGHAPEKVVYGVRALYRAGVRTFVFTNAAGGLREDYTPGDLALITDHLNLQGVSPLTGRNDDTLGPRFPDMTNAYDADLRQAAHAAAKRAKVTLKEGIYAALPGPAYETPAEVRMLRGLGADLVGMSTAPEVVAARHMGAKCVGISCITNMAAGMTAGAIDGDHVIAVGAAAQDKMTALLGELVPALAT